ncbi:unnamed protein product, partial [Timema podura]|nr:unnamed protein product [Timema podura]
DESVRLPTDTHNSNLPLNKKYQPSRYLYSEEEYEQNSQRYVPKHKSKKHKHRNSDYGQSENHIKPIHLPTIVKITDVPKKHDLNGHSIDERLTSSDSIPSKRPSADTKGRTMSVLRGMLCLDTGLTGRVGRSRKKFSGSVLATLVAVGQGDVLATGFAVGHDEVQAT